MRTTASTLPPLPSLLLFMALALGLHPSLAQADARVDVEIKDTSGRLSSGQVTVSAGSMSRSCTTVGGRCSVSVPGGTYQARAVAASGATGEAQVVAPSTGAVRVVIVIRAVPPAAPVGTTTGTSTTGSGTTSSDTPAPATASSATTNTAAAPAPSASTSRLRDLSRGTRLSIQGTVVDASGRLTNATIVVEIKGIAIGRATSVGGRFTIYDLRAGSYTVRAAGRNRTTGQVRVAFKKAVLKPTLRLAAR